MDHTPFIIGSYAIGFVVLLWTAVAPLVKKKQVVRDIRRLTEVEDRSLDSNP
jgi:heme exporter protein CcmD